VPDWQSRQRALKQQQHSAQIMASVNQSMQAGRNMGRWITIGTLVFVLVIFIIVGISVAGSLFPSE
jgi:hypothetical protein